MKYLVLFMSDGELPPWAEHSEAEQAAVFEQFGAFDAACEAHEGVSILGGEALGSGDTATVVRTRGGERVVTDGPYAEVVEQLGGYYLLEAPDLDAVLAVTAALPAYDMQITPVVDYG